VEKSEKFWDRTAKSYDNKEIEWEQVYNKAVEETKKYLNKDNVILDFACGAGVITVQLAEQVKKVHAIDISSKMLEAANRIANDKEVNNIDFEKTTIFDEKFEKESFDVITGFNILHLLEDLEEVLHRIFDLLKPDGLFISETPCLAEKKSFLGGFLKFLSKLRIAPYLKPLKFADLVKILQEKEFRIIEAEDLELKQTNYFIVAKK
jgi:2-polyprenyl-3-methyl-5-hydroxy-6-metoxy-1,4-benzoquinol methylase